MTKLLLSFSFTLMLIGLLGYFTAKNPHFTALIPSIVSVILIVWSGLYIRNIIKLKLCYIGVTVISAILLMGTWRAFLSFDDLVLGSLSNPSATISRGVTAVVTITFFTLISKIYFQLLKRNN